MVFDSNLCSWCHGVTFEINVVEINNPETELGSCVKVEVDVLGSHP